MPPPPPPFEPRPGLFNGYSSGELPDGRKGRFMLGPYRLQYGQWPRYMPSKGSADSIVQLDILIRRYIPCGCAIEVGSVE